MHFRACAARHNAVFWRDLNINHAGMTMKYQRRVLSNSLLLAPEESQLPLATSLVFCAVRICHGLETLVLLFQAINVSISGELRTLAL